MSGNKSWFTAPNEFIWYSEIPKMKYKKESQMFDYFILAISSDGRPYMSRTSAKDAYSAEQNFRAKYPKSQFLKANTCSQLTYIEQVIKHCESCGQVVRW